MQKNAKKCKKTLHKLGVFYKTQKKGTKILMFCVITFEQIKF